VTDYDPDVAAAFGGAPSGGASSSGTYDPDVSAAFGQTDAAKQQIHMPDGSLYTGQPWQDAILKSFQTPNSRDAGLALRNAVEGTAGVVTAPLGAIAQGLDLIEHPHKLTLDQLNPFSKAGQSTGSQENFGQDVSDALTRYGLPTPKTPLERIGSVGQQMLVGSLALGLGRPSPGESMVEPDTGPEGTVTPSVQSTQQALNAAQSGKSMGAASTAPDISRATPDLKAAISREVQKTGGAVNPIALSNQLEADSLPVPMRLTEGQAVRDPTLYSDELNNRAQQPAMPQFLADQHSKLVQNLQAIRDKAGPEVFSANPIEHGDTLIQAYEAKNASAQADISAKYQALRDAAGGDFPVDAKALLGNATQALHKELLFDDAPKSVMSTLGRLADNDNMTFENFESLRSNLARIQRSPTADGNTRYAAGIIRDQMEQLPLQPGAANLKPLADTARSAARAQFQALEADPAYKAAVNGDVPPDRFVQKFIVAAPRDDVARMAANLADNDTARQTMGVAAIDHLRDSAGIDRMGNGKFSQAGFNKNLQALSPKFGSLVDPQTAEHLQSLGNIARNIQERPPGAYVNESNTATTLLGSAKNLGIKGFEAAGNKAIPFAGLGTKIVEGAKNRAAAAQVRAATAPGAGLGRLSSLAQPP